MASDDDRLARVTRVRREPPPLLPVTVESRAELSPRMLRVTLVGDGLMTLTVDEPAASVRLLVPSPGTGELVIPEWNGNEFLLPDGTRPALRTFTPLRVDKGAGRLDIEVVRHPGGAVSDWAETVQPGAPAAISGPGTGFAIPDGLDQLIVLADETALPAVTQLVDSSPKALAMDIHVEVLTDDAILDLAIRSNDSLTWHVSDAGAVPGGQLVAVVRRLADLPTGTHVWAAGEASAMHAIRSHLFDTIDLPRQRATVRGYWKPPR